MYFIASKCTSDRVASPAPQTTEISTLTAEPTQETTDHTDWTITNISPTPAPQTTEIITLTQETTDHTDGTITTISTPTLSSRTLYIAIGVSVFVLVFFIITSYIISVYKPKKKYIQEWSRHISTTLLAGRDECQDDYCICSKYPLCSCSHAPRPQKFKLDHNLWVNQYR